MLKRKRSYSAGGLTSSCRIKAEALARAFNSRIWPCTWRSSASVRGVRQDEDEEFYEASSADDEDCGGRDLSDPCLTITSEQGRAKFCELLHAVDDATDVFYDVSEHAGLSGGGKVSEHPSENPMHEVQLHEPGENSNCEKTYESSLSDCLKYESSGVNDYNHLSTELSCPTSNVINTFDKSSTECPKLEDGRAISNDVNDYNHSSTEHSCPTSNVINTFDISSTECPKLEDGCAISNDVNDYNHSSTEHSCPTSNVINTFDKSSTECPKLEDGCAISNDVNDYNHSSTEHSCPTSNVINKFDKSSTKCPKLEDGCAISNDVNDYNHSSTEHSCPTSNVINTFDKSSTECPKLEDGCAISNDVNDYNHSSTKLGCPTSNAINTFDKSLTECSKLEDGCAISNDINDYNHSSIENGFLTSNAINTFDKSLTEYPNFEDDWAISNDINDYNHSSTKSDCPTSNSINTFDKSLTECSKFEDGCAISYGINGVFQSETECLKCDDSCEKVIGINTQEQSSTKCLHSSDNRDNPINCETSKDINDTKEPENSSSSGECIYNQIEGKDCDSATISQNIIGADKSINLASSIECLTGLDSSYCPSKFDSGILIEKIDVSEEPVNVNSLLECLKSPVCVDQLMNFNSGEITKDESTVIETDNFTYSHECLNDKNDSLFSPATHKSIVNESIELGNANCSSEFRISDMLADLVGDSDKGKICNCINTTDTPANSNSTFDSLNNISSEHIECRNLQTNLSKHNITSTVDFVDHDTCSYEEELLTVIIDSNYIDILQTPHTNLETISSSIDQCLVEQSHKSVPPDSLNSNNDHGATDPLKKANCPIPTQEMNDKCFSTFNNDCLTAASELHGRMELSDKDSSQLLVSSECLNCNNDQEAITSCNESVYPVLIEITKDGNSPIHKNGSSKFNEVESFEKKIPGDDCRLKVFDEHRPMISRSTSLKTGKTPPGTPSRKKIVRFADVLGLDLEDVRHIISGDLPSIPSSAYSDLVLAKDSAPPAPQSDVVELSCRQQASWESIPLAAGPNALYPLFAIPGQQPDFMERLRSGGVCLESVVIEDCNVQCTCRVMNWGYNKKVLARYTTNGWSFSSDINASYVSGSTRDGTDSFAFNIFLNRERSDLQFAIRYEINGNEYWDNNGGKNYCFSYNGTSQNSVSCSPTWMEQFW